MNDESLKVEFCFDPGVGKSVFHKKKEKVNLAFREVLPQSKEIDTAHFGIVEGTTLTIIVSGISVGAGIVVAEMLKECGKDLWRIVKKLIVPKETQSAEERCGLHDTIMLETKIGDSSMAVILKGEQLYSDAAIKEFLTKGLIDLYEAHSQQIEKKDRNY